MMNRIKKKIMIRIVKMKLINQNRKNLKIIKMVLINLMIKIIYRKTKKVLIKIINKKMLMIMIRIMIKNKNKNKNKNNNKMMAIMNKIKILANKKKIIRRRWQKIMMIRMKMLT